MFKKVTAFLLCIATAAGLTACGNSAASDSSGQNSAASNLAEKSASQVSQTGKVNVSVSFNAMKELTKAVGGDKVNISVIIPDGTEPHGYEPKAQDLIDLSKADVFVYNGFGMETWADKAVKSANNPKLIAVEASKGAKPIADEDADEIKEYGQYDPHLWLSLKGAEIETKNIRDALVKADAADKSYFDKNCKTFTGKLENLFQEYNKKFKETPHKSFVTGHAAFAYFCRDFGLTQNSVENVFAEGEPSAKQLSQLIAYCKKNKVTTIFAEDMASPQVSKTLAEQVGAKVETIHTMESSEGSKDYLERMQDNLEKIYNSLK